MIVRSTGTSQLLITQPDHASLAAHIMRHWRADGFPEKQRQHVILHAIDAHDNGWREIDAAPIVDPETGRILDFVHAPDEVRRGVWPRSVRGLAATPYAAALVAQHAIHVYRRYRGDSSWASFFDAMESLRTHHLDHASITLEDAVRDYFYLRIADLASLAFCNGWTEPQRDDISGYTVRVEGARLLIVPDPFGGGEVKLQIAARELPDAPLRSSSEARAAFEAAPHVVVSGVASGG